MFSILYLSRGFVPILLLKVLQVGVSDHPQASLLDQAHFIMKIDHGGLVLREGANRRAHAGTVYNPAILRFFMSSTHQVTHLLAERAKGNQQALDELTPLVYKEIRPPQSCRKME